MVLALAVFTSCTDFPLESPVPPTPPADGYGGPGQEPTPPSDVGDVSDTTGPSQSCSSCHADFGCSACHGGLANAAPPPDTSGLSDTAVSGVGAHQSHLGTSSWHAEVLCSDCHVVPVAIDDPGHIDTAGPAELTWSVLAAADGAAPSWDGQSCSGVYCHGATLISGGTNTQPDWTTVDGTQAACGTCHGLPPGDLHPASSACELCHSAVVSASDPSYVFADPSLHINATVEVDQDLSCTACHTALTSGSHPRHVDELDYACTTCHDGYDSSPSHNDGQNDITGLVAFDARNPDGTYNDGTSTCADLWCHGPDSLAQEPVWGGAAPTCGDCHPVPPTSASHPVHTGNDFSDPAAPKYDFACSDCHYGAGAGTALHVNFSVDVVLNATADSLATGYGDNAGNTPTWDSQTRTCSSVYCHSNGVTKEQGGTYYSADIGSPPDGALAYDAPVWGASITCGGCHAAAPLNAITSVDDYPPSGKHRAGPHRRSNVGGYTYVQCFWCHATSLAEAGQGTYGTSQHVDGLLQFHPYSTSNGGTIWPDSSKSYQDGHCGAKKGCWY